VRVNVEDSRNVYMICASRIFNFVVRSFASLMYCAWGACITLVTPLGLSSLGLLGHERANVRFNVSFLCVCGTMSCNWYLS
jgi:hypothetical protein